MACILVVCLGNVCRSPIAEGIIRARSAERLGDATPEVRSAGTAGWEGSGADPAAVAAAAELGVDISAHRARRLTAEDVDTADLIVGMAREHVDRLPSHAASRAFTLKELVRLLEALPARRPPGAWGEPLAARVTEANALRRSGFEGDPLDDGIADPLGLPFGSFRAVAGELDGWCGRLVEGLAGRRRADAAAGVEEE